MDSRKQKNDRYGMPSGEYLQALLPGFIIGDGDAFSSPDVMRVLEFDQLVVMTLSVMAVGRRVTAKAVCRLALRLMGVGEAGTTGMLGERMDCLCRMDGQTWSRHNMEVDDERIL